MSKPDLAVAGMFVQPRGSIRSLIAGVTGGEVLGVAGGIAGAAMGAAGSAAAGAAAERGLGGASPLQKGEVGYLAVMTDSVLLFAVKSGGFKLKRTDSIIASVPRSATRAARVQKKRLAGILQVTFADGSAWSFDVPRANLKSAQEVVAALSSP